MACDVVFVIPARLTPAKAGSRIKRAGFAATAVLVPARARRRTGGSWSGSLRRAYPAKAGAGIQGIPVSHGEYRTNRRDGRKSCRVTERLSPPFAEHPRVIKLEKSAVIDAPIGRVWSVLRDFNGHDRWHPAIEESRIEARRPADAIGAVRRFRLRDGTMLRERLLTLSDVEKTFSYCFLDTPIPLLNYVAHVALQRVTDGERTFWRWTSEFDTPRGQERELAHRCGRGHLRERFRRDPPATRRVTQSYARIRPTPDFLRPGFSWKLGRKSVQPHSGLGCGTPAEARTRASFTCSSTRRWRP